MYIASFWQGLLRPVKLKVLAIDYRLAPEHSVPGRPGRFGFGLPLVAREWICESSKIVIAGDSAGGGLALSTLVLLRDHNEKLPACAVCISPWVNLVFPRETINNNNDLILNPQILGVYADYYARNNPTTSPLISPIYADLTGLPPFLIHVGTDEYLLDEAKQFAVNARQKNIEVIIEIWEGLFHGYQIIPFLPETKTSLDHIAKFVSGKLR